MAKLIENRLSALERKSGNDGALFVTVPAGEDREAAIQRALREEGVQRSALKALFVVEDVGPELAEAGGGSTA